MLSPILVGHIANWANAGFPCVRELFVYRYQAAFPNTFVKIWVTAAVGGVMRPWVCQDVHYDNAGALQALGGFWIQGHNGAANPEQEWQNHPASPMRAQLYNDIVAVVPANAPDKRTSLNWTTVMEFLNHLDAQAPVSG
jgi:hypothetical protein